MADEPKRTEGSLSNFQVAANALPPHISADLFAAFSRARLPEDDPLWAVVAAFAQVQDANLKAWQASLPTTQVATAEQLASLEKRLQRPAVLVDAYEEDWQKALRFGLKFCLAPVLAAGLAWWFTSSHDREEAQATAQRMAQTPAAILQQNLDAMRTQISWSVSADQRILTLRVMPSADPNAWRLVGNGSITLAAPPSTASAGPDTRHR